MRRAAPTVLPGAAARLVREFLGTRQTGLAQLRVADLMRDADLLPRVQRTAELLLASYPDNIAALAARWIGTGERYGRVG